MKERGEMSMEKNRIRPVTAGKTMRMSYSRRKEVLEMPNLIEVQKDSYKWFLDEGLQVKLFDGYLSDYGLQRTIKSGICRLRS